MKYASIDIGSNSTNLNISEEKMGKLTTLEDVSEITRLGKGLTENNKFNKESAQKTLQVLKTYADLISSYSIDGENILVTATEASRRASNFPEFSQEVKEKTGLVIKLISAKIEASLTTIGILKDKPIENQENIGIIDIGGASTEVINCSHRGEILDFVSLGLGSVVCTELREKNSLEIELQKLINSSQKLIDFKNIDHFICCAGTLTTIGAMILQLEKFDASAINGTMFKTDQLKNLQEKIKKMSKEELINNYPFIGERVVSIKGGIDLAFYLINFLNKKSFTVTARGLRHGSIECLLKKDLIPSLFN